MPAMRPALFSLAISWGGKEESLAIGWRLSIGEAREGELEVEARDGGMEVRAREGGMEGTLANWRFSAVLL